MEFVEDDDRFTLYWMHGEKEVVRGASIDDAMTKAGYNAGALGSLSFFSCGDCQDYEFDSQQRNWVNTRMTVALVCAKLEPTSAGLRLSGGRSI